MRGSIPLLFACCAVLAAPLAQAQNPAPGPDMILARTTARTPEQVVDAVKAFSDEKKWLYLGASKVKQGEVTLVKVCIPEIGKMLWPAGLHVSALLPCGNVGIYQVKGQTTVSMLHPRYMQVLYPNPDVEKASAASTPMLMEMFEAATK